MPYTVYFPPGHFMYYNVLPKALCLLTFALCATTSLTFKSAQAVMPLKKNQDNLGF